jgi:hypothetical protein
MSAGGQRAEVLVPEMRRLFQCVCVLIAGMAVALAGPFLALRAHAQGAVPQGENLSARPPAQLFASDCTGSGCHRAAQGLVKEMSQASLASFLREHYTSSRESAAAMAAYLMQLPRAPAPSEARAPRPQPSARASRAAARPGEETPAAAPAKRGAAPRVQPARQTTAPPPPPPPEPPAPPPPPPPKQFDIFD